MFIIEKCLNNDGVTAEYAKNQSHLWVPAWPGTKSRLDNVSVDNAIQAFFQLTSRVKSVPYRLRALGKSVTLAAINTLDADKFKKYTIFAVGFYPESKNDTAHMPISQSLGAVAPHSAGTLVGTCDTPTDEVQQMVQAAAVALAKSISTHGIVTRYNTNGRSGGAWLATSITDGILSNSDIGITYSEQTKQLRLQVAHKFLSDATFGNTPCSFTGKMDHVSEHATIDDALVTLRQVTRAATQEEFRLLVPF